MREVSEALVAHVEEGGLTRGLGVLVQVLRARRQGPHGWRRRVTATAPAAHTA